MISRLKFSVEKFRDSIEETQPFFEAHFEELAVNKDVTGAVNFNRAMYQKLEDMGMLLVVNARNTDGKLVGYYWGHIQSHPHYQHVLMGYVDIFYLAPQYRVGVNGIEFLQAIEKALRNRSVQIATMSTKLHKDAAAALEFLKWQETDRVFRKVL